MSTLPLRPARARTLARRTSCAVKSGSVGSKLACTGARSTIRCCHGTNGEGVSGLGYQFSQGEILKTFPHIEDQLRWVDQGTDAYVTAGVEIYGDPNRAGGAHVAKAKGVMPAQAGQLTEAQILAVVCHELFTLGGADPIGANETEFNDWCAEDSPAWTALEDGSATFDNIDTKVTGAIKVGTEPAPGSSAGT